MIGETVDMLLVRGAEHRLDLKEGGAEMSPDRFVRELLGQLGSQQQGAGFFLGEHDGGKTIAFHDSISAASLSYDGNARFIQGLYIPVHRTQADIEAVCHFLGSDPLLTLKMGEDRMQSVDSVHVQEFLYTDRVDPGIAFLQ